MEAKILNFVEERERRLREHLAGKCKTEEEINEDRKKQLLRKQIAERAANNMCIIRELQAGKGRPNRDGA